MKKLLSKMIEPVLREVATDAIERFIILAERDGWITKPLITPSEPLVSQKIHAVNIAVAQLMVDDDDE